MVFVSCDMIVLEVLRGGKGDEGVVGIGIQLAMDASGREISAQVGLDYAFVGSVHHSTNSSLHCRCVP
jgi:hypothetical protein